jgi:Family of unknown function (DUF6483)
MYNKDYILRLAERFGRALAIIMHLRKNNKYEEALINIDELFLQSVGLTTHFVNSASEEMLLKLISPLDTLNLEKCLWIAVLSKEEGDIYAEMGKPDESYYRSIKALFFFLVASFQDKAIKDLDIGSTIEDILQKLEEFELPLTIKIKLVRYFELTGSYSKAEEMLFDIVESDEPTRQELIATGKDFYQRLLKKNDTDLQLGGLSRREAEKGLAQLDK